MKVCAFARKLISACIFAALPTGLARPLLNGLGHRIKRGAHIGFSWIWCECVNMDERAHVGHINLLMVKRLVMRKEARIGRMNVAKGPMHIVLRPRAALGNQNLIIRAGGGISQGPALLRLGVLSKITAKHYVDCTRTVRIGNFSTLAGSGSQVWTHGYVHDEVGAGRYRIDGRVVIEDNVYIGSACLLSMGVRIANGVIVGGGTTVASDLSEAGLYVSAGIRRLPRPAPPESREDLIPQTDPCLIERVYLKRNS